MRPVKYATLIQFIVVWSILGFPLLAIVTNMLDLPNTIFSIAFRTLAAFAALILLINTFRPQNRVALDFFLAFWLFYFVRLLYTTGFGSGLLSHSMEFYWIWGLGACFLPTLAVFATVDRTMLDRIPNTLLIFAMVTIFLALIFGGTSFQTTEGRIIDDINRLNISSLNPISMGHLGVTGVLLGISVLMSGTRRNSIVTIALAAIGLGFILAILANSRGPFLAMASCVALLMAGGLRQRRTYIFGIIFLVLTTTLAVYKSDLIFGQSGIIWRFQAIFSGMDQSTSGRFIAFQGAFDQFWQSPIFGDGIEERITGYYPHNVILEAFMATGILGGIPFLILIFLALGRAWTLVHDRSRFMWAGVLAVQYIVGGMFSGAIYSSNTMWILIGIVCTVSTRASYDGVRYIHAKVRQGSSMAYLDP